MSAIPPSNNSILCSTLSDSPSIFIVPREDMEGFGTCGEVILKSEEDVEAQRTRLHEAEDSAGN